MLGVYCHYKDFNYFSAGTVFIRQIITYKDGPRTERLTIYEIKGITFLQPGE